MGEEPLSGESVAFQGPLGPRRTKREDCEAGDKTRPGAKLVKEAPSSEVRWCASMQGESAGTPEGSLAVAGTRAHVDRQVEGRPQAVCREGSRIRK